MLRCPAHTWSVDRNRRSLDPGFYSRGVRGGRVGIDDDMVDRIRDLGRSFVASRIDHRQRPVTRTFPSRSDTLRLQFHADGDVPITTPCIWRMAGIRHERPAASRSDSLLDVAPASGKEDGPSVPRTRVIRRASLQQRPTRPLKEKP